MKNLYEEIYKNEIIFLNMSQDRIKFFVKISF